MKAVILAGGLGTRLSEETSLRPKPMVEIGGKPILWHIMKIYSQYGINDFIICLGYKGYIIKEYFFNYYRHVSDLTVSLADGAETIHENRSEKWRVTLVDTGENSMTGGRLKRIRKYLNEGEDFCMTYGDGLADIKIDKLIKYHNSHDKLATLTSVLPAGRFGALTIKDSKVTDFTEKPIGEVGYVNGGFFVLSPKVIDYIDDDQTVWEKSPMEKLAKEGQLMSYNHNGFWQPMDMLRDKNYLESLWASNNPPWKIWK